MNRSLMPAGEMTSLLLDVLTCWRCDQVYRIGRSALNGILKTAGPPLCAGCRGRLWITRMPRGTELN